MIVLNYHHVHDEDESFFRVTTKQFERQMQYILDCGYTFVTLDQFLERPDAPASVLVTFDDGYEDVYYNAAPILERLKIPAVMFLIAGYIGKWNDWDAHVAPSRRRHMTGKQAWELLRKGWTVGSHSLTHANLTVLDARTLEEEVVTSASVLENIFDTRLRAFSYPGGHCCDRVAQAVASRYDAGFCVQSAADSTFCLSRLDPQDLPKFLRPQGSWGFVRNGY